jgi:hypothetical protein
MRRLLLLLLLLCPVPAWAQTYVQIAQDDTDPFITDAIADITISPTSGNTVCVMFGIGAITRSVSSVVDSVGSTVYSLAATIESSAYESWVYCGVVVGSPTSISVTLSSAVSAGYAGAIEFSGAHTTTPVGNTDTYTSTTGTAHNFGGLTISGSSAVALAFIFGSSGTYTEDDYTVRYDANIGTDHASVAHKSITANDEMNLTTAGNEGMAAMAIEILPAADASGCTGLMLMGAGKC